RSIEINEINRRIRIGAVANAVFHSRPDKREVRISIAWFDDFLGFAQLGSKIDPVVTVLGAFGKQRAKRMKKARQQVVAVVHPQRQASVQIAGRCMKRTEKRALMPLQQIARLGYARGDIDRLESPPGGEIQSQFGWTRRHLNSGCALS